MADQHGPRSAADRASSSFRSSRRLVRHSSSTNRTGIRYFSWAYSAFACLSRGTSGSASFHAARFSSYTFAPLLRGYRQNGLSKLAGLSAEQGNFSRLEIEAGPSYPARGEEKKVRKKQKTASDELCPTLPRRARVLSAVSVAGSASQLSACRRYAATSLTNRCTDSSAMRYPTMASIVFPTAPKGGS